MKEFIYINFIFAWFYNIYSIYQHWDSANSFEATASIIGVPFFPLGSIMGYYWVFN
jgi:hypothetical protein